ncbi:G patch domain and ankyrin repeat-containing protein 1 [Hippoglossus stenolepis]|uniref:G patch domain and ankyrin repeat-containing protein 1 n=1 Tax=Hippoglossus stenolepis TaxID=195615 RepID=UPI001FAF2385|nr:G patch domain and ankyrin repeat-containing protein 1 [Hippoglossus stenolepis]
MATFGFTPASEQDFFCAETMGQSSSKTNSVISGEEARQFYENLTKDGAQGKEASKSVRRKTNRESNRRVRRRVRAAETHQDQTSSRVERETGRGSVDSQRRETPSNGNSERSKELLGLRFLRCANEGDVSALRELLSRGVDINVQDMYFWTAVMCASWSGQRAAVRLLLQQGAAWVGVVDTRGRDAKDLALEAGHRDVLEELESYGRSAQEDPELEGSSFQAQWCDVCCTQYSSSLSSHLSSTLHQFGLRRPPPTPLYCLPASSNSYKMMLRSGWKPGSGLGPEGEGPQQPVPTVLKRDHKGLGYGHVRRAKVTHFQARDRDAIKPPFKHKEEREGKGKRKEESRRKEQRDKDWEKDFRASFYL